MKSYFKSLQHPSPVPRSSSSANAPSPRNPRTNRVFGGTEQVKTVKRKNIEIMGKKVEFIENMNV